MVASHHGECPLRVREFPFLDILHPRSVYANGNFMLGFARDGAGMASDTFTVVDNESKVHRCFVSG